MLVLGTDIRMYGNSLELHSAGSSNMILGISEIALCLQRGSVTAGEAAMRCSP